MGIPEMRKRGYDADLATGSIAAGGQRLGILIPPSVTMILYGNRVRGHRSGVSSSRG